MTRGGSTNGCGLPPRALSAQGFALLLGALAIVRVENRLADPDRFWRDLDELVVLDPGERLLERHADRRREPHRLVLRGRADVGELLALQHIDLQIVVAVVL